MFAATRAGGGTRPLPGCCRATAGLVERRDRELRAGRADSPSRGGEAVAVSRDDDRVRMLKGDVGGPLPTTIDDEDMGEQRVEQRLDRVVERTHVRAERRISFGTWGSR